MRINNSKLRNSIVAIYFVLVFAVIVNMIVFGLFQDWIENVTVKWAIVIVVFSVLFLAIHTIAKYFEYDSDGEILVVANKGMVLSEFFRHREKIVEIPKRKLLYYKVKDYTIYRSLNLYLKSGNAHQKRIKFNITLMPKKKIKYLKMSLDKIVRNNKKALNEHRK